MRRFAFLAVVACLWGCALAGSGRAELIDVDFNQIDGTSGTYTGAAVLGSADVFDDLSGRRYDCSPGIPFGTIPLSSKFRSAAEHLSPSSGALEYGQPTDHGPRGLSRA